MILRRITANFRRQDWTAVTIELVVVILGVFIGVQASNWNQQRAEDAKAQAYLVRIRGDLQTDQQSIDRRVVYWRQVNAYGKQAIHYAETGELVDGSAWKTVLAFYQASQLWQWQPTDTTYQEMRSGGELGLIRDQTMRNDLARYYVSNGAPLAYLFLLQPEYRKIVRGLTPQVVADHIWAKCWQLPTAYEQYLFDCDSPIPETQAQAVLAGYLKAPNLLPELRFWVANQGVALNAILKYKPDLQEMLARDKPQATP